MDQCVEKAVRLLRIADLGEDGVVDRVAAACGVIAGRPANRGAVAARVETLALYSAALRRLLASPGIPQRTDAWYAARETMVTGSELSSAVSKSSRKQFFKRKLAGPSAWDGMKDKPAIRWGVKYEPVAAALYASRNAAAVHDFGLLSHPSIRGFGASPDGISDLGIMLEIKCPFTRNITAEVSEAYWSQIQSQLAVAGLSECDFLEVKFQEYASAEEFERDAAPGDPNLSRSGMEKGAVLKTDDVHEFSVGAGSAAWASGRPGSALWSVVVYSCVRVKKDDAYIAGLAAEIERVVDELAGYRLDPAALESEFPFLPDQ